MRAQISFRVMRLGRLVDEQLNTMQLPNRVGELDEIDWLYDLN